MVIVAGILGLTVGSFLNVVIYRVPLRQSVVSPPSACPQCKARIRGCDNIPVLSWLLLRGKCRTCGSAISARYPMVEFGTAILFALVARKFENSNSHVVFLLIAFLYLAAITIALALIDLSTHTLPNAIVLPGYVVGSTLLAFDGFVSGDYRALIRAVVGATVMWLLYLAMALMYPDGMGFGDVKFAGVLGLFLGYLGWDVLVTGAFAAFVLGGVFALALILFKKTSLKSGIPFGPWMVAGAWLGVFFGVQIIQGYLSIFSLSSGI
ncbi:MAG: prepilin peptidase [Candidatus Nanopelagicaceae bacterium]|nr:prepilin peptidase [Candidatus Nanopelagicaceae bacterium]